MARTPGHSITLAIGFLTVAAIHPVAAQAVGDTCLAPRAIVGYMQPSFPWFGARGDTTAPTPGRVAEALRGTYRLLTVMSEGTGAKWLTQWDLYLEPDEPPVDTTRVIPIADGVFSPLGGTISPRLSGYLLPDGTLTAPADGWTPSPDSIRVSYFEKQKRLSLSFGPFAPFAIDEAAAGYLITELRGHGFAGRILPSGFAVGGFDSPVAVLLEDHSGYFCAFRVE